MSTFRKQAEHYRHSLRMAMVLFLLMASTAISRQGQCLAQFNTERLLTMGRAALFYEDYVLSIQYFNQAIGAKPYLYEPWFYRAIAKYYLDDYSGAENDCSEAVSRNPYMVNLYELRGICRIQQKKFAAAAEDYSYALRYDPENRNLWHNRVLCRMKDEKYDLALAELDTIIGRWSSHAPAYAMRAEVLLQKKDTTSAIAALEKSIEIDPYDGQTWGALSIISLSREEWERAEEQIDKSIHLLPKHAGNYINRALARYNRNNLRGAMADYDTALDLEPSSFLGHYNRGLLRAQVGDDNRAIEDFDFVLNLEPDNMLALYNRGTLLDRTGNLKGAIEDYSKVIEEFPNFWTGLEARASCYRRLGMNKQADADENTVYRARLLKHFNGVQPKMDKKMRKRSDEDPEKYDQLVVADEQDVEYEYKNEYRGKVQNHKVEMELMPLFGLSFTPMSNEVKKNILFDRCIDRLNEILRARTLYINIEHEVLDSVSSEKAFAFIDSLSAVISKSKDTQTAMNSLFLRAVAYSELQDFESAIDDLSTYLQIDSISVAALWQRAVCQTKVSRFRASEGTNVELQTASALADLNHSLKLVEGNAFLLYNRATVYAMRKDYKRAIADYTDAIKSDGHLPEAYFNRGLCNIYTGDTEKGIADLSKAGELGIYQSYSIIKKYSSGQQGKLSRE